MSIDRLERGLKSFVMNDLKVHVVEGPLTNSAYKTAEYKTISLRAKGVPLNKLAELYMNEMTAYVFNRKRLIIRVWPEVRDDADGVSIYSRVFADDGFPPIEQPHEGSKQQASVERWIPICAEYEKSMTFLALPEKGGDCIVIGGKIGTRVLAWVKVKIDPSKPMGITILEYCKLPEKE